MNFYVLSGGQSRRMGRNKALLELAGQTLIERVLSTIPPNHPTKIITNSPEEYEFLHCEKISDIHTGLGPIGGLHAGLTDSTSDYSFFLACDMPFLSQDLIQSLLKRHVDQDMLGVQTQNRRQPLCAIYSKECLPVIERQIERREYSLQALCDVINAEFLETHVELDLFNVNTEEDWLRAQGKAASQSEDGARR